MKTEKMIWGGVGKNTYTAPESTVVELSTENTILDMSGGINSLNNNDYTGSIWVD